MVEIVFQHGWAFSAHSWEGWRLRLAGRVRCVFGDRGYFGPPSVPDAGQAPRRVAVCHSLGLHLLPAPVQASLDGLVVVGGFVAFGGPRRPLAGRHLQRLHRLLDGDPAAVLRDFYQDCDVGHLVPNMEGLDLARLRSDLVLLGESRFDPAGLASGPRIVLLHGDQDRIVPLELGEELHEALPGSTLAVVPGAGHGLPFTHAEACLAALERLLGDGWPGLNVENTSGPREMLCGGGPCR